MVEMSETANILHNATDHSLVLMDEVGRHQHLRRPLLSLGLRRVFGPAVRAHPICHPLF